MNELWQSLPGFDPAAWSVWLLTCSLLIIGLAGTILPLIPGPIIIFIGGVLHTLLRPESGMSGWGIAMLALLLVISYVLDFFSGALGSKWFGGSKWGIAGVIIGGIIGLFFSLPGLILGPLIGGFAFEVLFAKKRIMPATKSTFGTAVGTTVGIAARFFIGLLMVAWFFADALWL
jgi:uncharacterized protein